MFIKGVQENKNIPAEFKPDIIAMISKQFQIMSQYVGTIELMLLREKAEKR